MNVPIIINLWGTFSVAAEDGDDLTPKLSKCQALLALLATARDGRRTRSWLQSRLWSDRGKEQASGSLRQALSAIRKALGGSDDILIADRLCVSLDLENVHLNPPEPGEEFLAGMDIRDDGFEDWLRLERSNRAPPRSPVGAGPSPLVAPQDNPQPVIVLSGGDGDEDAMSTVRVFLIDCVARSLRENFSVRAYTHQAPPQSAKILKVRIAATVSAGNQVFLSARCIESGTTELLWTGHQIVHMAGAFPFEDLNVLAWINEIVAAIAEFLGRYGKHTHEVMTATHLGLAALRELFSMQVSRVEDADRMLARAYEMDPRAVFLSWRAQLHGIQLVERHGNDPEALREKGLALARAALEAEPSNSSVLATTANARLILDQDSFASDELSRQSVIQNPSNPLAWWSRAFNYLYTDRLDEALAASERGHRLSKGSPYRFWWEMQVALSASAGRRVDQAILAAERSAVFAPDLRPPMRYLIGLHAENGTLDRAAHWAKKLKKLEPDFLPERLVADNDYPASLLRKYDLVQTESLKPLTEMVARS